MVARPSRGASLLRSSRMFSIPKPLRVPDQGLGLHNNSDTATTPFPLHLSVTTPETSRAQGDWGFKRPLPLRQTTRTSTPIVRVKHIDSIEAITDYASAADHSLTLEKFHEMNLAVSAPVLKFENQKEGKVSVFESANDSTVSPTNPDAATNSKRWKFHGPWLASLSEEEFNRYLARAVRPKRAEFRTFLRERRAEEKTAAASREAMDNGMEPPAAITPSDISDAELADYIRSLRSDRTTLYWLMSQFLDLAPIAPPQTSTHVWANSLNGTVPLVSPYAQDGPPVCHPSAGLSYLRTNAFTENHALYGPQRQHSPVLSRILSPQRGPDGPKLGMGGFVTNVPPGTTSFALRFRDYDARSKVKGLSIFDPSVTGGASVYLVPKSARVLWDGRVAVKVEEATAETQLVKKELSGSAEIYMEPPKPKLPEGQIKPRNVRLHRMLEPREGGRPYLGGRPVVGSLENYGLKR